MQVVDWPVTHGDLVDALDPSKGRAECSGDVTADGEQAGGLLVIEFGEIVCVRLPHHNGVSRNSWIEGQHDAHIVVLGDAMLRAEYVAFGEFAAVVTDSAIEEVAHSLTNLRSPLSPLE